MTAVASQSVLSSAEQWRLVAEFDVRGVPAPGGSKTFMPFRRDGEPIIKDNRVLGAYVDAGGERNKQWRKRVAHSAKLAYRGEPLACPLMISFLFCFERPKSHYGTGRNAGTLRDDAPREHEQKPDVSKLIRSTEDACTGILWADDCHVVEHGPMRKSWSTRSGATIRVWAMAEVGLFSA